LIAAVPATNSPNGALIGGIIGGILALLLVIALIAFIVLRQRRGKKIAESESTTSGTALPTSEYGRITTQKQGDYEEATSPLHA
jgi:uncharacterized membrane protein